MKTLKQFQSINSKDKEGKFLAQYDFDTQKMSPAEIKKYVKGLSKEQKKILADVDKAEQDKEDRKAQYESVKVGSTVSYTSKQLSSKGKTKKGKVIKVDGEKITIDTNSGFSKTKSYPTVLKADEYTVLKESIKSFDEFVNESKIFGKEIKHGKIKLVRNAPGKPIDIFVSGEKVGLVRFESGEDYETYWVLLDGVKGKHEEFTLDGVIRYIKKTTS